ncbi:MAG: DUF4278 domain-containing protein [Microcoleus sp. SIO2G3]|nr:DUF4278 domain-containing protein [Microcoleus sp. SIO2G3]
MEECNFTLNKQAMRLYFRGVSYEYHEYYLSQREVARQSVQILQYRGVSYLRERQSSCPRRISAEVPHSTSGSMQLNVGQKGRVMQPQRMSLLCQLYCLGWRNSSLRCLSLFQHRLLNTFCYYLTGCADGFQWRHYLKSQQLRE